MSFSRVFSSFAGKTAKATGSPWAFVLCVTVVLLWAASGPVFGFSDTWQLVINTGTTVVTFLMVFLIQNTQNRDGVAIQTKLDELILTSEAEDEFVGIENLSDKELEAFHDRCVEQAKAHADLHKKVEQELMARGKEPRPDSSRETPQAAQPKPAATKPAAKARPRRA
jgi:low affinity Fe/Cu permease